MTSDDLIDQAWEAVLNAPSPPQWQSSLLGLEVVSPDQAALYRETLHYARHNLAYELFVAKTNFKAYIHAQFERLLVWKKDS